MDALDETGARFPEAPGIGLDRPEPAGHTALPVNWWGGLIGLGVAIGATIAFALVLAVAFSAAGVENLNDNKAFEFLATFAGDFALVGAAWGVAAERGRVSLAAFGLRPFKPSALGWVALAFVAYLVLAGIYTELVNPPPDKLPQELGVKDSTFLAVLTGVFVIAIAPFAEEFFFRGFLFQALRNSWGVWLAAPASALIFSGIHLAPDKFVQLAILGTALAFVFHKTDSLWPCILLHALNNTLAFAVTV
jgi:membrane protease YdiL (CAAX protease family)